MACSKWQMGRLLGEVLGRMERFSGVYSKYLLYNMRVYFRMQRTHARLDFAIVPFVIRYHNYIFLFHHSPTGTYLRYLNLPTRWTKKVGHQKLPDILELVGAH